VGVEDISPPYAPIDSHFLRPRGGRPHRAQLADSLSTPMAVKRETVTTNSSPALRCWRFFGSLAFTFSTVPAMLPRQPLYSKASDHSSSRIPTARLQLTGYCSCRWTHCLRRGRSRAGSRANRFGALNGPIMMAACEPSTYPAGWRWIWTLAIALVTIFSNSARAWPQTPQPMPPGPPPNRKRPALTPVNPADEDFSFLRNPANRTDPWDPLKVPGA